MLRLVFRGSKVLRGEAEQYDGRVQGYMDMAGHDPLMVVKTPVAHIADHSNFAV